jgi:hypothetical protein
MPCKPLRSLKGIPFFHVVDQSSKLTPFFSPRLLNSVMDAWGKWTKTNDKITLAADGNGEFVTAAGLSQGR